MNADGAQVPAVLTIAGSDCSGGAGIQADLKTFTSLGVYGASVITALTAQNTVGVQGVHVVPPEFVRAQLVSVFSDLNLTAVKTGMLACEGIVQVVAETITEKCRGRVIVDPVMVATSGDRLLSREAEGAIRESLLPLATLVTPNLPEAAALLDGQIAESEDEMVAQARKILEFGPSAVLIKGGHARIGRGNTVEAVDVLVSRGDGVVRLVRPWVETINTHGTGCTLSAAIAAKMAIGYPLDDAVKAAKEYLWQALSAGRDQRIGSGHGPVDHMHRIR